jgi:putative hydrolase of the HAD superfamily
MGIKAVIFDYGKVICFPPDDSVMDEICALGVVERALLDSKYWKYRGDFDLGKLTVFGFYRNILEELGREIDEDKLTRMGELDNNSWKNINPGTVRLMEDVKKAGLVLGILSNMPTAFLEYARVNIPVFSLPHFGIYSCEVGCMKPEAAIYLKTIAAAGCRAEELVFFDDVPENVDKALELGINARLWQDCDKARSDLTELGLRLLTN